jgi:hypothetical protein
MYHGHLIICIISFFYIISDEPNNFSLGTHQFFFQQSRQKAKKLKFSTNLSRVLSLLQSTKYYLGQNSGLFMA